MKKGERPLARAKIKMAGEEKKRSRNCDCQRPATALLEDRYPILCRKIIAVAIETRAPVTVRCGPR
jgi:hypothetical protein